MRTTAKVIVVVLCLLVCAAARALAATVHLPLILRQGALTPSPTPTLTPTWTPTPTHTATPTPTLEPTATATPTQQPQSYAERVVALTNAERTARGLPTLTVDTRLTAAADRHTLDMATNDYVSHEGSDGSGPEERIRDAGYSCGSWGENIGAGYVSPEEAVAGWMASSLHRDSILSTRFTHIGVGYAYSGAATFGHYWTQVFASPG